jgi:hypothetical protein
MPTQPYKLVPDPNIVDPDLWRIMGLNANNKEIRVPGTTTVCGRFKDSGALIYWANQEGLAGRPIRGAESQSEQACEIGTLSHAMVEADIRGTTQPDKEEFARDWIKKLRLSDPARSDGDIYDHVQVMLKKADSSFNAYLEWKGQTKLKPFHTELPLVSKRYLFGGTIDAVQLDNKAALLDWKTSNGIYQDHIIQVGGGYSILWEENFPNQPITGGFHILRFSKTDGDLTHHTWQNLDMAKEAFIHMRILFEIDKQLKMRL